MSIQYVCREFAYVCPEFACMRRDFARSVPFVLFGGRLYRQA